MKDIFSDCLWKNFAAAIDMLRNEIGMHDLKSVAKAKGKFGNGVDITGRMIDEATIFVGWLRICAKPHRFFTLFFRTYTNGLPIRSKTGSPRISAETSRSF
jgi:hypothetical protein